MITLTRLSGQRFALNPDLMERIEATPDTVITLVDGSRYVVAEGVDAIVDLVCHFRAGIMALAQLVEVTPPPSEGPPGPALRLIGTTGGES